MTDKAIIEKAIGGKIITAENSSRRKDFNIKELRIKATAAAEVLHKEENHEHSRN